MNRESDTNNSASKTIIVGAGKFLNWLGPLGLPLGLGVLLGFYAADQGVRWLPTLREVILVHCVFSLLAMAMGRMLQGKMFKDVSRGQKVRKRVTACLVLAGVASVGRLVLFWAEQPSSLTLLSPSEFNLAFEIDTQRYLELDQALDRAVSFLEQQGGMFDEDLPRVLSADEEHLLLDAWATIYDCAFALDQIRLFYEDWYRFDPSRVQRSFHLRSFLLTYAAELSLYEKSTRLTGLIIRNENAVKFLDAPHENRDLPANSFSQFRQDLQGARDRARVIAGDQYLLWLDKGLDGRSEASGLGCGWLWQSTQKQLAVLEAISELELSSLTVGSDLQPFKRTVKRLWFPTQKKVAEWMGDTRIRRIGRYLITHQQQEEMDKHLEPGDVMLSRKNWYLSNVGLPGFWPHAILYIGDPGKFESYFDDPLVLSYIKELSGSEVSLGTYLQNRWPAEWFRYQLGDQGEPYRVLEAVSEGVMINTMAHASGDYMMALRPRLDKKAKAQAIIEAFSHLGKPYDFDFDFATDHALVCTEVVWRSYRPAAGKDGLRFTLKEVMGRKTLPANEIAKQYALEYGQPNSQLDFVYFLDARESLDAAVVATVEDFLTTFQRSKWDLALD